MIVCDEKGIEADKYRDILYNSLFSLVDNLLESLEEPGTIQVADENTLVFMDNNIPCHKVNSILEFLEENNVLVM